MHGSVNPQILRIPSGQRIRYPGPGLPVRQLLLRNIYGLPELAAFRRRLAGWLSAWRRFPGRHPTPTRGDAPVSRALTTRQKLEANARWPPKRVRSSVIAGCVSAGFPPFTNEGKTDDQDDGISSRPWSAIQLHAGPTLSDRIPSIKLPSHQLSRYAIVGLLA